LQNFVSQTVTYCILFIAHFLSVDLELHIYTATVNLDVNIFGYGLLKMHNCMTRLTVMDSNESGRLKAGYYTNFICTVYLSHTSEGQLKK
jgi:hypothetical protein